MKLIFKQRLLSVLDSYDIYDEFGNTEYIVKGEIGLSHRFRIYNNRNIEKCLYVSIDVNSRIIQEIYLI